MGDDDLRARVIAQRDLYRRLKDNARQHGEEYRKYREVVEVLDDLLRRTSSEGAGDGDCG